ncbi:MAG: 1-acyl-sn-glycerol-3-phosphate acyltransferase [Clostridiales Family XIII bacterium]|jgi:1-acyl-sn-glycerol-3-phosphate acyltransferase|nr:1-acyl-sn-glycerol-3-phosphate acyltransferase [Clostridiales Family XIII bacterium]
MLSVVRIALRNLPFVVWLFAELRHLRGFRRNIAKYRASGEAELERREILKATSLWGDDIVKKLRVDLRTEGETQLPDGPVVFVSNHESYADIPLFCAVIRDKQFGFVAKRELSRLPVFGKWIAEIRSVFLERSDARASLKAMEDGVTLLRQGFSLVVFPEGTRGRGGPMRTFKRGSLRLAAKPGVAVVPVTHMGCYRIFEESGAVRSGVRVRFCVHPAMETAGMSKQEAAALTEAAEDVIRAKLAEWRAEEAGAAEGEAASAAADGRKSTGNG